MRLIPRGHLVTGYGCNHHQRWWYIHFCYFDISDSPANIILKFFPFQMMDLTIERWFPIKSDTLYKMKWLVIPYVFTSCLCCKYLSSLFYNWTFFQTFSVADKIFYWTRRTLLKYLNSTKFVPVFPVFYNHFIWSSIQLENSPHTHMIFFNFISNKEYNGLLTPILWWYWSYQTISC